jgi:hypothetical protein
VLADCFILRFVSELESYRAVCRRACRAQQVVRLLMRGLTSRISTRFAGGMAHLMTEAKSACPPA